MQFLKEVLKRRRCSTSRENNAGSITDTRAELHTILRVRRDRRGLSDGATRRGCGSWTALKLHILRATRRRFRQTKRTVIGKQIANSKATTKDGITRRTGYTQKTCRRWQCFRQEDREI